MQAMTPSNPRWEEFITKLTGPEGCHFRIENGHNKWDCKGGHNQWHSAHILRGMGLDDSAISESLTHFTEHGGHCDCEIVFNVAE